MSNHLPDTTLRSIAVQGTYAQLTRVIPRGGPPEAQGISWLQSARPFGPRWHQCEAWGHGTVFVDTPQLVLHYNWIYGWWDGWGNISYLCFTSRMFLFNHVLLEGWDGWFRFEMNMLKEKDNILIRVYSCKIVTLLMHSWKLRVSYPNRKLVIRSVSVVATLYGVLFWGWVLAFSPILILNLVSRLGVWRV